MPRGTLKTTIVTKYLPTWLTIRDDTMRSLIATNTHPNARKKLQDIRGVFDTHVLFQRLFPELLPTRKCRWTDEAAEVTRKVSFPEATFEACGKKTKKVGTHYNLIIEDDTTAPDVSDMTEEISIPSREEVEQAIGWHVSATSLLVPKGPRIRIIVTTRWADYDLVSYLKEHEPTYKVFDVPARKVDGTPIFSMFYDKEKLHDIESQIGPYMFSCLYLNAPLDSKLRVFQDIWFQWISTAEAYNKEGYYSIAIDPAISEKSAACETAITLVKHSYNNNFPVQYWFRIIAGHFSPSETVDKSLELAQLYLPELKGIIVETTAYQESLMYQLREAMTVKKLKINLIPFKTRQNKELRIQGLQPYFANGRIFFVRGLSPRVESQLKQFPNGKLVDIIDSFSMHKVIYKELKVKPSERKTPEDAMELLLKEIRAKSSSRNFNGVLPTGLNPDKVSLNNMLSTGLGLKSDSRFLFSKRN